jgi:hypothetical protein
MRKSRAQNGLAWNDGFRGRCATEEFMRSIIALLLLSSAALAQNEAAIAKARAACGPENVKFDVKEQDVDGTVKDPEQGKGLIYIIGEDGRCNTDCGFLARIGMNGSWVGAIRGNSQLSFSVEPGEQHLCANWQTVLVPAGRYSSLAKVNVEPGKTYYFRVRLEALAGFDLDLIDSEEGKYLVAVSQNAVFKAKK